MALGRDKILWSFASQMGPSACDNVLALRRHCFVHGLCAVSLRDIHHTRIVFGQTNNYYGRMARLS